LEPANGNSSAVDDEATEDDEIWPVHHW
jgi:hypothetical protein